MHLQGSASRCANVRRSRKGIIVLCLAACGFLLLPSAFGETWLPHPDCASPSCDDAHTCLSNTCTQYWDVCPAGQTQTKSDVAIDTENCYDNGCGYGGCDAQDYKEVSSERCINLAAGCLNTCKQETCCKLRAKVTCCLRLGCRSDKADCQVPQQQSLGPNTTGTSNIAFTKIADGGTSQFPFYLKDSVPSGTSCESQRVWAVCKCSDGLPQPGCLITDSSTWYAIDTLEPLQKGLSLTCITQAADPAGSSPASTDSAVMPDGSQVTPGGSGTQDDSSAAGQGGGGEHHRRRLSGGAIALIVVISVLGGLTLVGGGLALLLIKQQQSPAEWTANLTGGSNYEPVFTGASYTPNVKPHSRGNRLRIPKVSEVVTSFRRFIQTAKQKLSEADDSAARAAYTSHRAKLDAQLAAKYPLNRPALPHDIEEEELYTLEDLDEADNGHSHYGHYGQHYGSNVHSQYAPVTQQGVGHHMVNISQSGAELELGHVKDMEGNGSSYHKSGRNDTGGSQQTCAAQPQVIHTTPVILGPPPPAASHHDYDSQGVHPVTPQPTGGLPPRPYLQE